MAVSTPILSPRSTLVDVPSSLVIALSLHFDAFRCVDSVDMLPEVPTDATGMDRRAVRVLDLPTAATADDRIPPHSSAHRLRCHTA